MKKFFTAILVSLFTSVTLFAMVFAMSMDEEGNMVNCPYMEDGSAMCSMTGYEHLTEWKMNFLALKQSQNLLMGLAFAAFIIVSVRFSEKEKLQLEWVMLKWRQKKNDFLKERDPFLKLFSLGILHSKVY